MVGAHSSILSPPQKWAKTVFFTNVLNGSLPLTDQLASFMAKRARASRSRNRKIQSILCSAASDLGANATWVLSNESSGIVSIGLQIYQKTKVSRRGGE